MQYAHNVLNVQSTKCAWTCSCTVGKPLQTQSEHVFKYRLWINDYLSISVYMYCNTHIMLLVGTHCAVYQASNCIICVEVHKLFRND